MQPFISICEVINTIAPTFTDYGLEFQYLYARDETDLIVIHHTGDPWDDDLSAGQIHASHIAQGWSGCGYHYIVRKDGSIEIGRPEWAIGSHAYGFNFNSIGIHVCGNFEIADPTPQQIESTAYLVGWLCDKYGLIPTAETVKAHRDLMPTACCGQNLYDQLQTIRGKAIWYTQNYQGGD